MSRVVVRYCDTVLNMHDPAEDKGGNRLRVFGRKTA